MSFPPDDYPILNAYGTPFTDFGHFIHINHAVNIAHVVTAFTEDVHVHTGNSARTPTVPTFDIKFISLNNDPIAEWKFRTAKTRDEYFSKVKQVLAEAYAHYLGG